MGEKSKSGRDCKEQRHFSKDNFSFFSKRRKRNPCSGGGTRARKRGDEVVCILISKKGNNSMHLSPQMGRKRGKIDVCEGKKDLGAKNPYSIRGKDFALRKKGKKKKGRRKKPTFAILEKNKTVP